MQNFKNIKYTRISLEETKTNLEKLLDELSKCPNYKEYLRIISQINSIQSHIEEMTDIADINNMRDLSDKYWDEEISFWNANKPKFDSLFVPFYKEILNSPYQKQLSLDLPDNFFRIIESQLRIVTSKNDKLLEQESNLKRKYLLLNKKELIYDGKPTTINALRPLFSDKDREVRKKAHDAVNDFYYENRNEYQKILYELIKIRNEIAKNAGFPSYVEYSLYKLKRFGYDYHDIKSFRESIKRYIVPLCDKLSKWQQEELGLTELTYYDTVFFTEMPKLKVTGNQLLQRLKELFSSVDDDLANIYDAMYQNGYIDVLPRDTKVNFSITNYLTETAMPVVTGNFKNTFDDVQAISHEMGHAFQKYCASIEDKKHLISPLLKYPTMEIAEMFSYAMELIMSDKVGDLFDPQDYKKYCFINMYELVSMLPYICAVDEFQETIYSKPDLSVSDINATWLKVVKEYHLGKSNTGHKNLDDGGYFYRQNHIFLDPFYYIDYALSYVGALLIWNKSTADLTFFKDLGAVASYYSFKDLIAKYNMPNPFDENAIADISKVLDTELNRRRVLK